ncbi:unnamed protein product [Kluyveromyces dobzhanskii CBS 2104]|uniref:WGS project CCBQ000000000 data, contig 00019 n=1 Tax=Kluyveromyces dobzhanskii CBS 2104 TaxID=1427455 RepID=A0A0A8L2K0_9SACH|nr:unnamed protein product [Kluyveromyces dobzhanskii CBS 2104]
MINKAAPGLFPHIEYGKPRSNTVELNNDPLYDIDEDIFLELCQNLPANYDSLLSSDRFYLSRLYLGLNPSCARTLECTDFAQFNRNCDGEFKLRNKLQEWKKSDMGSGVVLPQFNQLEAILTKGYDVVKMKNRHWRNAIRDLFNKRGASESSSSRYEIEMNCSTSQPSTNIIDNTGPELDFIDFKFEDNGIMEIQQVSISDNVEDIPIDNSQRKKFKHSTSLKRKLKIRHLQMISLGATIGVGLFLNSGRAFAIAGPMGAFIGYLYGALVILATLFSFAEIVAFIPLITGISGLCSRFVGDAFGFTVGWCHWLSYAVAFPSELIASVIMISYYSPLEKVATDNTYMGVTITILIVVLTGVNLLNVKIYGELEYIMSVLKLAVVIWLIVLVIVLNCGGFDNGYTGFKFWTKDRSPLPDITFGPFRPTYDLRDYGFGSKNGIGGFGGVLLSCITCSVSSTFSYIGSEIGFIAAPEAENPRKAVPSVTKRIFVRVVLFYLLSIFIVGTVIYSGDPRLLRIIPEKHTESNTNMLLDIIDHLGGMNCNTQFTNNNIFQESSNQSPWVIAFKAVKQCKLANAINGVFVCIGISAASSQLYASSRTLYSMATQNKAPSIFTWCTTGGVPYVSVLFCGLLGFLSLLCFDLKSSEGLLFFISMGITGSIVMWFGMNLSFFRFYLALKRRPDIIDRNSKEYPYKSPFQPYLCIFGMISTAVLLAMNGIQNFFVWRTANFISSYLIMVIFITLYAGYNIVRTSTINSLEQIDLDSGRREMDRIIWKENADYTLNVRELFHKVFSYV